jgi:hypothetical protein
MSALVKLWARPLHRYLIAFRFHQRGASSSMSNRATGTVGSTSHNTSISADRRACSTSSAWISALGSCQCHRPHSVTTRSDQSSASSATRYATSRAASSTNSRRSTPSQLAGSRKCRSNTRATSSVGTKSSSMLPLCARQNSFRPNARTTPPSRVKKIAKTNGSQRQSTPHIWPRHPEQLTLQQPISTRPLRPGQRGSLGLRRASRSWLTHQLSWDALVAPRHDENSDHDVGRRLLRNSLRGSYLRGVGRRLSVVSFTLRPCYDSASPNKHRAAHPCDCRPVARAQSLCVAALKRRPEKLWDARVVTSSSAGSGMCNRLPNK